MAKIGGPRIGAGRKPGGKNQATLRREVAIQKASALIEEAVPGAFKGDAHAYLISVYKDPRVALEARLDAAKAAMPFEKPRLQQTTIQMKRVEDLSDEQLAALIGDDTDIGQTVGNA